MPDQDTSGFYKQLGSGIIHAPNFVLHRDYELRRETKDQHTYPVEGWAWFDSEEEAHAALLTAAEPAPPKTFTQTLSDAWKGLFQ
jgi:hypothetical protein